MRTGKGFQSLRASSTLAAFAILCGCDPGPNWNLMEARAAQLCVQKKVALERFWWDSEKRTYFYTCTKPYYIQEYPGEVEK